MIPSDTDLHWSRRHADAVREAAPEVPEFTAEEGAATWEWVAATAPTATPRRSRWKLVVAGVLAVGAVGVAGAATAGVLSAHTGKGPVDAEDVELGGPGERLDPSAPDFAAVLDEVTTDIRFPSVRDRDASLSWWVEDLYDDGPADQRAMVSTGALRLWVSGNALCSWSNVWAVALRTDDTTAEGYAAEVILGARDWPSITDTDPDLADESEFAWLPDLERAVRADDPEAARAALHDHGACMPGLAPELGLGKRW